MPTALIIDDEKSIRITFQDALTKEGFTVMVAENWIEAENILKQQEFDIVFLDILLPQGISGIDILKKLKVKYPETLVIMMTGDPSLQTASESVRLEAYDYLTKPVTVDTLRQIAARAYERKKLNDEKKKLEMENEQYAKKLEQLFLDKKSELEFQVDSAWAQEMSSFIDKQQEISKQLQESRKKLKNAVADFKLRNSEI